MDAQLLFSGGQVSLGDKRKFWKTIWDSKGKSQSKDLLFLDGYEHLDIKFSSKKISDTILKLTGAKLNDTILEIGCGAGFLAQELQQYDYWGVDYSKWLIKKHVSLFPEHNVMMSEADDLPFEDNSFDIVFCYGVFQYLPSTEYAEKAIEEMKRVARKAIFLGDLKKKQTREEHYVYPSARLYDKGYEFSKCVYQPENKDRYNAHMLLLGGENDLE
jgi:ubiquinone/menaquinone biosynthesis C-methylase UbiE